MPRYSRKRREIPFYAGILEYGYEISIVYAFQLRKGDIKCGRIGTWTNPSYTIKNPHYAALKSLEKLFEHIAARHDFNKRKIRIVAYWDSQIRNGYSSLKNSLETNMKKYDVQLVSVPGKMWRSPEHVKTYGLIKNFAESCV
ncbi:Oidioi.mRNA.OKI2018_I69.chr2.g7417.t1.cds [Oikopleura dioica]|uniref:Oidioi.mRNA.OKI2018_I69.chr2.g7417.t1.cds n=1 Tax=Oikopleura dioica TaxID=34765 RepID=A0ABN7TCZ5_OIKDI|nr:Oidioi.mRNA.OKI2018_I69.chr2.g7417.t1.cds [Oikopleura dioica]